MTTTPSDTAGREAPTREAADALAGVETAARSVAAAAVEPATGITGAQSLVRSLEAVGVEVIFGIPGGAILPAYDPLFDSKVRHVLVRHEQGAGHAATGYAQATGKVGVCMATSGPGATNLVTPLADAHMDSVPIVAITGQVPSGAIGTDAFQEADIRGITMPVTKHNFLVTDAAEIPQRIAEAFHLAATGRPGPVLVDIPKDVLQATTDFAWPPRLDLPGYKPTTRPHGKQVREAAALISAARRPVLYVGGGVLKAQASAELARAGRADRRAGGHHADGPRRLPRQPPAEPRHAGHARQRHRGDRAAEGRRPRGARRPVRRPRDRRPGQLRARTRWSCTPTSTRPRSARTARPTCRSSGDAKETIAQLVEALRGEREAGRTPDLRRLVGASSTTGGPATRSATTGPRTARCRRSTSSSGSARSPDPTRSTPPGVGQHQMWAAQFVKYEKPGTWLNSGGLGTMGYAVPGGHGRQVRPPGDDGLGDRRRRLLPDDQPGAGHLRDRGHPDQGRRHQQRQPRHGAAVADPLLRGPLLQHQAARAEPPTARPSRCASPTSSPWPRRWAASGCGARRKDDVDAVIEKAMAIDDAPVVIDFVVGHDAQVWPMVAAGASNDDILAARDVRPVFGEGQV